jgi:hypothetical protein
VYLGWPTAASTATQEEEEEEEEEEEGCSPRTIARHGHPGWETATEDTAAGPRN